MTLISLVYAQSRNGVIGRNGGLPWRLSSDLKRFKTITLGKPVIMGRKTWDSLPQKPLPGRLNIVITRQKEFSAPGATVVASPEAAIDETRGAPEICVIGGAEIFASFLPRAGRIYLSEIDAEAEGDTLAPPLDMKDWRVLSEELLPAGPLDDAPFAVRVLERN